MNYQEIQRPRAKYIFEEKISSPILCIIDSIPIAIDGLVDYCEDAIICPEKNAQTSLDVTCHVTVFGTFIIHVLRLSKSLLNTYEGEKRLKNQAILPRLFDNWNLPHVNEAELDYQYSMQYFKETCRLRLKDGSRKVASHAVYNPNS